MKRLTTVLFVIASLILLAPIPARADMKGKCGKNLQWVLDDDGKLTITGSGRMDDFSKSSQPWRAALVRSVEFPEGLTYIGNNALNGAKIGTANLPSTVTGIGKSAFANCKKMTTAVLPYGLTSIGESAFKNCRLLADIQIPPMVKSIGNKAFDNCQYISVNKGIIEVIIADKDKVTSEGENKAREEIASGTCGNDLHWVLNGNGNLLISGSGRMDDFKKSEQPWDVKKIFSLTLSEELTCIGNNAFNGAKITSVNLPSGLISIGELAFANCKNLTTIGIPPTTEKIGRYAFRGCSSLKTLTSKPEYVAAENYWFYGLPKEIIDNYNTNVNNEFVAESTPVIQTPRETPNPSQSVETQNNSPAEVAQNTRASGNKSENNKSSEAVQKEVAQVPEKQNVTTTSEIVSQKNQPEIVEIPVTPFMPSKQSKEIADNNQNKKGSKSKKEVKTVVKYGDSDIDKKVPETKSINSQTFAFIFANENYDMMPNVPFAINDGKSFATYCQTTLGIPETNINVIYDASLGNMRAAVKYLQQVDEAFKGDISVIFYYAGHGAPDMRTVEPYLVPTDAYAIDETACYPLETLYKQLGELKAKSVKVFIDACFSGADRNNDMLAQGGRLVATVPKKAGVTGNVVVISATSNEQAAWQYAEQGHGLFTYCLIKKLQETKGNVSMGEINDYLIEKVPQISIVINRMTQTPTYQSSSKLGDSWRQWEIRK